MKAEAGGKVTKVQTGAAGTWDDRVGIAVKGLLFAEIRGFSVDPDERVLVAGNRLELVCLHVLVALNDGLPVHSSSDDTTLSSRLLTALGQLCFVRDRFVHGLSPSKPMCSPTRTEKSCRKLSAPPRLATRPR